ncbi:hypothetical protein SUGI_0372790 [Cryptomeria japonica]|nr:hypothetical protein SUGI_0372790 [Cryptomeria japonica]
MRLLLLMEDPAPPPMDVVIGAAVGDGGSDVGVDVVCAGVVFFAQPLLAPASLLDTIMDTRDMGTVSTEVMGVDSAIVGADAAPFVTSTVVGDPVVNVKVPPRPPSFVGG